MFCMIVGSELLSANISTRDGERIGVVPYIERHLPDGFTAAAVATAPSLAWNRDDALQDVGAPSLPSHDR
jgi:hypothetical protein